MLEKIEGLWILVVIVGTERRKEHLLTSSYRLAKFIGGSHLVHEFRWNRFVSFMMQSEHLQNFWCPCPLLEKLRWRFYEIPFGRDAREGYPLLTTGEEMVKEMAKL